MTNDRRPRRDIDSLVADLAAQDGVERESAITRLSLIGIPAVEPLIGVAGHGATATARVAALQALELIGAAWVLEPAGACLNDPDPAIALAALDIIGRLVRSEEEARSLDLVTTVALDVSRDDRLRLQALRVLAELPRRIVAPIWRALGNDPSEAVRQSVSEVPAVLPRLADLDTFSTIVSPAMARELVLAQSASAPLTALRRFVDHLRAAERAESNGVRRAEWAAVRGALHQALAVRGSRVALYDLRETIETAGGPLPAAFLSAVSVVGDVSCLDGLAAAYARAAGGASTGQDWWRDQLRDTFRQIVRRKRLSSRHPAMRKIAARWPGVAGDLVGRTGRARQ